MTWKLLRNAGGTRYLFYICFQTCTAVDAMSRLNYFNTIVINFDFKSNIELRVNIVIQS